MSVKPSCTLAQVSLPDFAQPLEFSSELNFKTPLSIMRKDVLVEQIDKFKKAIASCECEALATRSNMYGSAIGAIQQSPCEDLPDFLGMLRLGKVEPFQVISEAKESVDKAIESSSGINKEKQEASAPRNSQQYVDNFLRMVSLPKEMIARLMLEFKSLHTRNQDLLAQINKYKTSIEVGQAERSLQNNLADLDEKLIAINAEIHEIDEEISLLDSKKQALSGEINEIARRLGSGKGDKIKLKAKQTQKKEERTPVLESIQGLIAKKAALSNQSSKLGLAIRLEANSQKRFKECNQRRLQELEKKIESLESELSANIKRIQEINGMFGRNLAVNKIGAKLDTMESRLADLEMELRTR